MDTVIEPDSPIVDGSGVLVEDLGLEIIHGDFAPVLKRGSKAPCEATFTFSTFADNQDQIMLTLYRGTGKVVMGNHFLGKYQIVDIPPAPARVPFIAMTFRVMDGTISIDAIDTASGRAMRIKHID